mgnify:CR=1 FL=1
MTKYTTETKKDSTQWTVSKSTSHTLTLTTFQHSVDNTECLESQTKKV